METDTINRGALTKSHQVYQQIRYALAGLNTSIRYIKVYGDDYKQAMQIELLDNPYKSSNSSAVHYDTIIVYCTGKSCIVTTTDCMGTLAVKYPIGNVHQITKEIVYYARA